VRERGEGRHKVLGTRTKDHTWKKGGRGKVQTIDFGTKMIERNRLEDRVRTREGGRGEKSKNKFGGENE